MSCNSQNSYFEGQAQERKLAETMRRRKKGKIDLSYSKQRERERERGNVNIQNEVLGYT